MSWTAGRWSGGIGSLNNPIQQIAERGQICDGNYNAGTYDGSGIDRPVSKQSRGIWAHMRKRQNGTIANDGYVELSIAKKFRNVVRVDVSGRDLHKAAVLEEFGHEYTDLYLKLFLKRDE